MIEKIRGGAGAGVDSVGAVGVNSSRRLEEEEDEAPLSCQ